MRKIFKTAVATVATAAMAVSLMAGYAAPVDAAVADALKGVKWTHEYNAWDSGEAAILNSTFTATESGFTTNIASTGWQREWEASAPEGTVVVGGGWQDNPFALKAIADAGVAAGTTYKFSFTIANSMVGENGAPTEKNVLVTVNSGIPGDTDNTMLNTFVRVPANSTETFTFDINVNENYSAGMVRIEFAYGPFMYSYEVEKAGRTEELKDLPGLFAPGATEGAVSRGELTFSDVTLMGEYVEVTTVEPQTRPPMNPGTNSNLSNGGQQPQQPATTVAPTTKAPATTTKAAVKKPAKVKIKSAKNVKGKKIKITWKKVSGASKYQVKVGTKKKTTKKLSYTMKGLKKKKTYKVQVRAYKKGAGYGKWSKTKKVKVTK